MKMLLMVVTAVQNNLKGASLGQGDQLEDHCTNSDRNKGAEPGHGCRNEAGKESKDTEEEEIQVHGDNWTLW